MPDHFDLFTRGLVKVVVMETQPDNWTRTRVYPDYAPLHALERDRSLFHAVGSLGRPGVMSFSRSLELRYFPPLTKRNADYRLCFVNWMHCPWLVATIPNKVRRYAERIAEQSGLRLADGVPTAFDGDPKNINQARFVGRFPLNNPNVYSLEFAPGREDVRGILGPEQVLAMLRQEVVGMLDREHERETAHPEERN